ncbi:MAG: hypothetical protein H0T62_07980 [Parachlamydiaceae bacterium]|nr:hypothetical protein [Parachlamydiaceae bacterium]
MSFQSQLRHEQEPAANALLAHNIGVLSATNAVIAAWLIAQRQVNTLV